MKAIKLASVFAVSAIAAAVSSTTFAAEPVFSGQAGLNYHAESGDKHWSSEGEVNIIIDTGLVYIDLDMESANHDGGFNLDEAYVKTGAVSFGDFDGSLSSEAAYNAGVWEEGEYEDGETTDYGIRYAVTDGLTVALEMLENYDGVGAAVAYEADLGGLTLGVSGGSYSGDSRDETTEKDVTNYSVGVKVPMGPATLIASYSGGDIDDVDFESAVLGADVALTDAFSISAQFSKDIENKQDNSELTAYYTAGGITYFATNQSGDVEATTVGAYVDF